MLGICVMIDFRLVDNSFQKKMKISAVKKLKKY